MFDSTSRLRQHLTVTEPLFSDIVLGSGTMPLRRLMGNLGEVVSLHFSSQFELMTV